MKIIVRSLDDGPDDLFSQTPFEAEILRQIPGPDRPDYWLASLTKPLHWRRDGKDTLVTHIVVGARMVGTQIGPAMRDMGINISYVTDQSTLADATLDFKKSIYVAIGFADSV